MGKLFQRNDCGTWYAEFYDRNGKRQKRSTRTADKAIARERLREFELATTDRAANETETLDAALRYFLDVTHAASCAGTLRCYRQKAGHVSRLLGDRSVDSLTREDVDRYIATRIAEGAHPHTLHKDLVVLRGALKASRKRDRFHGPADLVPEFDAQYEPRRTYLTPEQFERLADHIVAPARPGAKPPEIERRERRKRDRILYCLLIAFASPRRGELEAIDSSMVDLDRGVIRIPRGKTVSRPIALHPLLRLWIEARIAAPDFRPGPLVARWTNVGRDLPAACLRAGVPKCTPNDLRRTFSSWLVQAGESLFVVSRLLGHSSTRMVELVYGQLDERTLASAIDRLPGGRDDRDAGGTNRVPKPGNRGTRGHAPQKPSRRNTVEDSGNSATSFVPRDGVEPPTRGFSGLRESARASLEESRNATVSPIRLRLMR